MFAYCGNNPVNRADPTGHAFMQMRFDTDGVSGMLTPGPWGGGSGGVAYAGRAFSSAVSSIRNEFNKLSYISQEDKNSAQIVDSYKVTNPVTMYMYIDEYRGDEISGSTTGVVAEWIVHDIAYGVGWVLNECGLTGVGQEWMDKGMVLDIGSTIYDDQHEVFSIMMWSLYLIVSPICSKVDLVIEIFE